MRDSGMLGTLRDIQIKELETLISKTHKRQDITLLPITNEGDYACDRKRQLAKVEGE